MLGLVMILRTIRTQWPSYTGVDLQAVCRARLVLVLAAKFPLTLRSAAAHELTPNYFLDFSPL
jgi:hypothetical protein